MCRAMVFKIINIGSNPVFFVILEKYINIEVDTIALLLYNLSIDFTIFI